MNHPNPDIYREAAKLIASKRENYSCFAITAVCCRLRLSYAATKMYRQQYAAAFGFAPGQVQGVFNGEMLLDPSVRSVTYDEHPFWNRPPHSEESRKCRILALLFMAELVANP